jgi:ubiquinone/menaquinone biosynthesis C-methylase UbiE
VKNKLSKLNFNKWHRFENEKVIRERYKKLWDRWEKGFLEKDSDFEIYQYILYSNIDTGDYVLEIGIGGGTSAELISKTTKNAVFGDLHFMTLMYQKMRQPFKLVQFDGRFLPFSDESFNKVLIRATIHNLPFDTDRTQVFKEVGRVLKNDGCLILSKVPNRLGGLLTLSHYRRIESIKNWIINGNPFFCPINIFKLKFNAKKYGLVLQDIRVSKQRLYNNKYSNIRNKLWSYYTKLFIPIFSKNPIFYDWVDMKFRKRGKT